MCNSNSRRWLVKDNRTDINPYVATLKPKPFLKHTKRKCRSAQATAQLKHPCATRTSAMPSRVNPACLNQIIEVLLAILLANCLAHTVTHVPTATAAFGVAVYEGAPPSILSSRHSSRSSSRSSSHDNYRQSHRVGGPLGDEFAFAYNSLQAEPLLDEDFASPHHFQRSQNYKISPKPCSIGRIEGTCMFVWECIKSEGRHVGMCVDSFMFGSCCAHNYTENIVLPPAFSYTRPTKPVGISSLAHRPRPPHLPHRPSINGMTTIERPHGAGTLVIRPSGPHHQGALHKPQYTKPPTTTSRTTTTAASSSTATADPLLLWTSNAVLSDMQSAASASSASTNMWDLSPQHSVPPPAQQHWHMTTEPNFITKPRPPSWEKPTSHRPKPPKPTKKPIVSERPALQQLHQHLQQQLPPSMVYSTRKPTSTTAKPRPQPQHTKPTKAPATTRPYSRPTSSWATSESVASSSVGTGGSSSSSSSSSSSTQPISSQQTTSTSLSRPTTTTTTAMSPAVPHKTTYRPPSLPVTPTQRPSVFSTNSTTAAYASTLSQTLPAHNHTTIESNEITDTASSGTATIKTISAARSECGVPVLARPETRIVGGKSAAFGRWPWQVSVRRTSFFGFSSTHRCGGALINENWIATAGHCVDDLLISQIRIRVGEYDFSHVQEQLPYIERGVAKKVVHPKYNFFTYEYDLALVKLEQSLEFAPHVSPICLPQTDSLLIGMNATVTGWGRLSEGGTLPSVLQEVSVPIVSNDNCKTMFLRAGRQEFIPEIFLCAGYETGGQDSCQGDSGGPLQVKSQDGRFFLAGIISWGIGCAEANLPGVCTRISKFVPWIMENVT